MSTFIVRIDCPRIVAFEDGEPVQCEGDVDVICELDGEYRPQTHWSPAEYPSTDVLSFPTTCTHGAVPVPLTDVEKAEWSRRAALACEQYEPEYD